MEQQTIREVTGMIHRTRRIIFGPMFCRFGSEKVKTAVKICRAARNRGIPITAIVLLLQPLGTLFVPKWVAMVSGIRFQSRSPITIGKREMSVVRIRVVLYFFHIRSASFEL